MSRKSAIASRLLSAGIFLLIVRGYSPIVKAIMFPNIAVEKDITQLLAKHEITGAEVSCNASGRVAQCNLNRVSELNKLITGLNLRDFESEEIKTDFKYHNYWLDYKERRERYESDYTCGSLSTFKDLDIVRVYGNLDRSPELVLVDTGAFEHFFLYHRPDRNEVCIHFTYAYG
ncbi:MAG: hypothetical protein AAFO85_13245 [Cyanobacteria bacterium J06598_4]